MNELIMTCPHCNEPVIIGELNCKIFRHCIYKSNLKQVNPHMSESSLKKLIESDKIYGCGKPFRYSSGELLKCDYI